MSEHCAADAQAPNFEWFAFEPGLPAPEESATNGIAAAPGAVARDEHGRALALHFAPARWLLLSPAARWLGVLSAAAARGRGVLSDVTGRWRYIEISMGADRAGRTDHPLSAGAPLDMILRERDVASLLVFDCPVLIARRAAAGFEVWVEASYEASFREMLAKIGDSRAPPPASMYNSSVRPHKRRGVDP